LDSIFDFGAGPVANDFTARLRQVTPELPDEPTEPQLDAWVELAELLDDADFRTRMRDLGRRSFGTAASGGTAGPARASGGTAGPPAARGGPPGPAGASPRAAAALAVDRAGAALAAGIAPDDPTAAAPIVAELVAAYGAGTPAELLESITAAADP